MSYTLKEAKNRTRKWLEDELELMGYVLQLSRSDSMDFHIWFKEETSRYQQMKKEIEERAEWLDSHSA